MDCRANSVSAAVVSGASSRKMRGVLLTSFALAAFLLIHLHPAHAHASFAPTPRSSRGDELDNANSSSDDARSTNNNNNNNRVLPPGPLHTLPPASGQQLSNSAGSSQLMDAPPVAVPVRIPIHAMAADSMMPNSWLFVFKSGATAEQAESIYNLLADNGGSMFRRYDEASIPGMSHHMFVIRDLPQTKVVSFANGEGDMIGDTDARAAIEFIEPEAVFKSLEIQPGSAPWHLDRIDQNATSEPYLDGLYSYTQTGRGVTVYVLDTGVRTTHNEFGGRASFGFDAFGDGIRTDCNGHGSHVAGLVGSATYGTAKEVTIVSVRVLDCEGSGSTATLLDGFTWVAQRSAPGRKVLSLSLGGPRSTALDMVANQVVDAGITVVVAAGNEDQDACNLSPAAAQKVITVAATDRPSEKLSDRRADYSNWGSCVTLFAPGSSITSLGYTSNSATAVLSGTSMATPIVSGVAAMILQANPSATPSDVKSMLLSAAFVGVIDNPNGSPNRLLRSPYIDRPLLAVTPDRDPEPDGSPCAVLHPAMWTVFCLIGAWTSVRYLM